MHKDSRQSVEGLFIRKVIIVIALAGLALLLWQLRHMLLLVFGAVLVAVIFRALAAPLHRRLHLPTGVALGLAILLLAGAIGIASWFFGREVAAQVQTLAENLPAAWRSFETRIGDLAFGERLEAWAGDATPSGSGIMASAGTFMSSLGAGIAETVLVIVGGIYLAAQPKLYREGLLKLLPRARRDVTRDALDDGGHAIKAWLGGQLIAMTIVGVLVGAGLWALGVPLAFALGLIAGLLDFVPLVGPIVAAVPALLLALTVSPTVALWTALLFLIVQQIEGNIVSPLVQQHAVDLPPALMLFALLGFGGLFGVVGVIFAAPLSVFAYVMVKRLYVNEALDTPTETSDEAEG
ncbi:MAG: AI-2E family transporter [Pseudomonadota bacterium]|nr:AI-2E family transporter [Pseudomonadota bacterium]